MIIGELGLAEGFAHEVVVAGEVNRRLNHLSDGTGSAKIRQVSTTNRVMDLSATRRRLQVTGADRVAFLHGQCTNDIKRLQPGAHCYAAFLSPKGKMRGDAEIVCLADAFILSSVADLQGTLEKYVITEDVVLECVSAQMPEVAVWGEKPAGLAVYDNRLGGWNVLGRAPAGEAMTVEEWEVRRVEAGVPLWGVDMDENTIPVEAGLAAWGISYDKGCYIGQETIARIKTYGHVNRHLVQLGMATMPERSAVTSVVESARLGKVVALAYMRRELAKPGATVTVGGVQAEVIKLCGS